MNEQINKRKIFFQNYELIINKNHENNFVIKNNKTIKKNINTKLFGLLFFIFTLFCLLLALLLIILKLIYLSK